MGEVYLAEETRLRRKVALKTLPIELAANKDRMRRFEQEATAAAALNHPNIATIHEIGEHNGASYIAMEFIDGETLRERLKQGHLKLGEVLEIATQTAGALAAAHAAGIIHRDIKPENIMVRRDGYIKVLDFGLAKLTEPEGSTTDPEAPTKVLVNTDAGTVMGTANYMSPEQAKGKRVDGRTDLWSLGAIIYEMVAGHVPFEAETPSEVIGLILNKEPPPLARYAREAPSELERIVEKALTKERGERYQLAKDLSVDLKRLRQRLEMEAELERSVTPEEAARRSQAQMAAEATAGGAGTPTAAAGAAHFSSAEYVVGEIKRHKLGAMLVLAAFVVGIAAFVYFSYFRARSATINSVAVLPFANTSGDPNMDYLSDGLSDSLINSLSQLPSLKVIARGSVFKYKGKEVDPQEVARALGVQAIVTGRVVQRGDQLQVNAELMNVSDKTQMWGEQFNRKATDLLQVQTEISQRIAEQLRQRLTSSEQQQLVKEAKANPQAYELLLKGRFYTAKTTPADYKKAVEYFNQALAIDPNYARAYAELAITYRNLAVDSFLDPKETIPKAEAAARKALELDDSLPEAHTVLGYIKRDTWDWVGAEQELKRALEMNPNLAGAHQGYAFYLGTMLRHEQAIAEVKRARELDPLALRSNANIGYAYYWARQYDQAIEQLKKTLELDQNFAYAHVLLGYAYAAKGDYTQAIAEYRESIKLTGENTSTQCYLGAALALAGQRPEAETILKQLETTKEYVSPDALAALYAGLGDKEKALASLERAYAAHDLRLQFLAVDPKLDGLRAEPRFRELIRKLGLPG